MSEDPEVFYNEETPTESGAFLSHIGTDLSGTVLRRLLRYSDNLSCTPTTSQVLGQSLRYSDNISGTLTIFHVL